MENDRLGRLYQNSGEIGLFIFRARLKTPACNVIAPAHALLVVGIADCGFMEETYTRTHKAPLHGFLRQKHYRGADFDRYIYGSAGLHNACGKLRHGEHIVFEGLHRFNLRQIGRHRRAEVDITENIAETVVLAIEKLCDFHNHRRRIGIVSLCLKRCYERKNVVVAHRTRNCVCRVYIGHHSALAGIDFLLVGVEAKAYHHIRRIDTAVHTGLIQFFGHSHKLVHNKHVAVHEV